MMNLNIFPAITDICFNLFSIKGLKFSWCSIPSVTSRAVVVVLGVVEICLTVVIFIVTVSSSVVGASVVVVVVVDDDTRDVTTVATVEVCVVGCDVVATNVDCGSSVSVV